MDVAKCTINDTSYYVVDFSELPEEELSAKRRALVCTGCGNQAYFKRAAISGQGACFGARPHAKDCKFATPEIEEIKGELEDRSALSNPGNHIILDLQYGAHESANVTLGDPEGSANPRGMRYTNESSGRVANSRRRLSTVLKTLINSDGFRQSEATIEVSQEITMKIKDFFVNFNVVGDDYVEKYRGFWGLIYDTGDDPNGGLWLNTGRSDKLSILVVSEKYAEFKERFKLFSSQSPEGMHVLVIGQLLKSSKGKLYIKLEKLERCTLCDDK
tara:strand:+ start:252 stop:1070 length:819 start_codon:yes stop_codon:yes gene_type:complete